VRLPLDRIASIEDLRRRARRRVPRPFFEYLESGSFGELTLRRNREDLDRLELRQRVMVDVSRRRLESSMLGEKVAMPLALAPVGLCGAVWPNGEILSCRAAQDFGIPFCLSTNALLSIEDVAQAVSAPFWFQLYLARDRGFSAELIERARSAGCSALILTMDLHVEGTRYADVHNGLGIPPRLTARNLWSVVSRPRWALGMLRSKRWSFGNYAGRASPTAIREMAQLVKSQLDPSFDARSLEWVRGLWPGKLVVKGIMEAADARIAVEAGADAVLVSNHGGRQLDSARSTVSALPEIVEAVGGRTELFVDGGVRSGLDVLKFLALGARGCFVGRAYLYGLGAFGGAGVARALEILRDELDVAMALTGSIDVGSLASDLVAAPVKA
jgi:L-lactate dehydrogenase (cytochrome)